VKGSDLVILCAPVEIIPSLVKTISPALKEDCIVTDVGSTKETLCNECMEVIPEKVTFVGSHPMAGSEKSGLENATSNLFENRSCFITPIAEKTPAIEMVIRFWEALGMSCICVSPEEHDAIAAHISHLPHLLASVLCAYLSDKNHLWKSFAGTGLMDTTRIASGSPDIWDSIIRQNIAEIELSLEGFQKELKKLDSLIKNRDYEAIRSFLVKGKEFRDSL
jgi:cyclohexadieny/prephenate dehydrogenase